MNLRVALAGALVCVAACTVPVMVRSFTPAERAATLSHQSPYLKAHLRNGEMYVLSAWNVDDASRRITGTGDHLDVNRHSLSRGEAISISIDDVALFETNVLQKSKNIQSLAIMTGVSVAATAACLASPKSCFGSCPTFYSDGVLEAEGFSSSILPSLEKRDIDALYRARSHDGRFELRMTNEAQETHVVRYVRLLAAPRPPGSRVFAAADGTFWRSSEINTPSSCHASEGDCTEAVRAFDSVERFSRADANNLGRREHVDLHFRVPGGRRMGVVIAARQTLLSTFLLYTGYSYMGTSAVDRLAKVESDPANVERATGALARLIGGIDVLTRERSGKWIKRGKYQETGPLATDVHLIPLPYSADDSYDVRLDMTKGLWRLDAVLLVSLDEQVQPIVVEAQENRGPLVTLPGDQYTFTFNLPSDDCELFLDTRGYYLEWMRREWMVEESSVRAAMMLKAPQLALRLLAPEFKRLEPSMEKMFWSSRYALH